jgi:hypothetical protein
MNRLPTGFSGEQVQELLRQVLRELHGPKTRLDNWTAAPVSKRGKLRAVRYDVEARSAGEPELRRHQWVGKFYERDDDARRVAAVLRELADFGCRSREGLVIPSVLAYHATSILLLLAYESGESLIGALARQHAPVLLAIGRALATLHKAPVTIKVTTSATAVLDRLRRRVADLCARFSDRRIILQRKLAQLEREMPRGRVASSFLHGDLGPAQLLWQAGNIVMLDFDKCTRGDAALDLGNLLTQIRRLTLRKPEKLPDFALLRWSILDAYKRWSPPDPGLLKRVAWYEQVTLLRKIQFLASDTTRHKDAESRQQRQAEAVGLMRELPALLETA